MVFLALLIVPLLIAGGLFLFTKGSVTKHEFAAHIALSLLVAGASAGIIYCNNTADWEIRTGSVVSKLRQEVTCEHDYCCQRCTRTNCTGSGKDRRCHTETYCCRWCKHHPFDVDWVYNTSDNGRNTIERVDWQGLGQPPRWTVVQVGEPSASSHSYENYIKASPDSLFSRQGLIDKYADKLPQYPGNVYDYYRIKRLVQVGTNVPDANVWNDILAEANKSTGPVKEGVLSVVLVKDLPIEYFYALEQHWLGGKKNDFIVVIGVNSELNINWVDVMAWSTNKLAETKARNAITVLGKADPILTVEYMKEAVLQSFQRKSMKDFEYLKSSITPTTTQWIVSLLINILISVGAGIWFHLNDFTDIKQRFGGRRRW